MIEIVAKLVREQTPVFLCGEAVELFISFTNPSLAEHRIAQSNNDILENLAWATGQIHCYRSSTDTDKSADLKHVFTAETALNASNHGQGNIVMATEPKILFCDLRLAVGESKSYLYKEVLPMSSPPTYRGVSIKYFYKLTIATQRVGSKVQVLRIPIRVLSLPTVIRPDEVPALCNETNDELAPTNPFLEKRKTESKLEIALHHLQNITARRRPNFYLISNKRGRVGRFCLFKPAYKLGEDIVGTLDFTCRTVRCVQVSVTLQCEEILLPKQSKSETKKEDSTNPVQQLPEGKIMNFTKHHEVCVGLMQSQMILPVPLHVTPSFSTSLVDVRWRLHFEFVTSTSDSLTPLHLDENNWQAPVDIPIETMVWNLPITLYPTSPMQILQQFGKHSLIIK
ncbi:RAB6A-GEF complex partner protein 2 [Pseudolycoriella hygida]|uniref:RAB6A-GEF complex partner protein 2 n=1 Tax=Pseudolycoriella hygida TaxID=35572 RepID=A0A9Q0MNE5_9DIPT|nr:RAB6A-GEF complex partner protein 2 [Pseudolycoriella hygida]